MDNIKDLYTNFSGRIGRKTFWLGILGIAIVGIILSMLLSMVMGVGAMDPSQFLGTDGSLDMNAFSEMALATSAKSGWVSLIVFIVLFIPVSAIMLKRRHDRGSAGMEYWVYAAFSIILFLLQATGFGYTIVEFGGIAIPTPTLTTSIAMFGAGVIGIFLIVVCGFLKGNEGSNSFGPDPLG